MKLRKHFKLEGDIYKVTLVTEDWSELDMELMAKYGEPEIDLGGDFTVPTFSLPNDLRSVMSASPFTERFDKDDNADAEDRAGSWETAISARITTAMATLRANTDSFTKEEVETI
jgi:hypothetical protein